METKSLVPVQDERLAPYIFLLHVNEGYWQANGRAVKVRLAAFIARKKESGHE